MAVPFESFLDLRSWPLLPAGLFWSGVADSPLFPARLSISSSSGWALGFLRFLLRVFPAGMNSVRKESAPTGSGRPRSRLGLKQAQRVYSYGGVSPICNSWILM